MVLFVDSVWIIFSFNILFLETYRFEKTLLVECDQWLLGLGPGAEVKGRCRCDACQRQCARRTSDHP